MSDTNCIIYRINKDGIIVFVGKGWDQFALANKGSQLLHDKVLHKPLLDFITDWQCRHLYELLIDSVTVKNIPVSFSYRCDAPAVKRFMTMQIIPLKNGITEFRSCIDKKQSRKAEPLLDTEVSRSEEFVVICAWCKKINTDDNLWDEVEHVVKNKGLFQSSVLPKLSHGICPVCLGNVRNLLN